MECERPDRPRLWEGELSQQLLVLRLENLGSIAISLNLRLGNWEGLTSVFVDGYVSWFLFNLVWQFEGENMRRCFGLFWAEPTQHHTSLPQTKTQPVIQLVMPVSRGATFSADFLMLWVIGLQAILQTFLVSM